MTNIYLLIMQIDNYVSSLGPIILSVVAFFGIYMLWKSDEQTAKESFMPLLVGWILLIISLCEILHILPFLPMFYGYTFNIFILIVLNTILMLAGSISLIRKHHFALTCLSIIFLGYFGMMIWYFIQIFSSSLPNIMSIVINLAKPAAFGLTCCYVWMLKKKNCLH